MKKQKPRQNRKGSISSLNQRAKRVALINDFERYLLSQGYQIVPEKKLKDISSAFQIAEHFRVDYYLPESTVVEINGGQWVQGRHNRAGKVKNSVETQYERDLTKSNIANAAGLVYLQFTYEQLARNDHKRYL